ncbi:hypothetical protein [Marinomonas flavescens]|uniref:hypothetical protein n=1 Tax=Marinomonas flavescens TaxID=2529379 RepID=UPI0010547DC9|nr:hypothetical protein [Marinomonas flavescens]
MVDHTKGLIAASRESSVKSALGSIAEASLDTVISTMNDNELLKDIPIIGSLIAVVKGVSAINNAHTLRKFANFIGVINELSETEAEQLQSHLSNEKNQKKIIEETILYLDRYHNELKAKLLGQLFKATFLTKSFTSDEYNTLLFSIEQIHPYIGIPTLKDYYNLLKRVNAESDPSQKTKIKEESAKINFQPLMSTGLLDLPIGGNNFYKGSATMNEFGQRFYENVVQKTNLT